MGKPKRDEELEELRIGLARAILPHIDFSKKPAQPKPQVKKPERGLGSRQPGKVRKGEK